MSTLEHEHDGRTQRQREAAQRQAEQYEEARAALVEDLEWLLRSGEPVERIPARLGLTAAALARTLYRMDRAEQARPFSALAARQRGKRSRDRAKDREYLRAWRARQRRGTAA